ncbi:MAG: flippase-like domain-containing protein [Xanthomonadales bacterium]|nr:flippase-like domain-containing protein [Xanthomonadales bacterium]
MTSKNIRALVVGIIISLAAFYFALRNVDFSALANAVLSADLGWMAVVLVSYMVHYWFKAMRWRDLLEPVKRVTTTQAYPVMMTGFFANNILPAHLGEFVRMYVGSKLYLVSKTQVLATIVLERLLDFSTIAVLFGGALVLGSAISEQLVPAGYVLLGLTLFAWLVIFIFLRFEEPMLRFTGWLLKPLPDRFVERVLELLLLALSAMHSMTSTRLVIRSVVLSLLQWALVGLAVFAALESVGVEVGMAVAVITLAATVLAVALPAAPGFFGTIQLAFVLALAPYGIAESDALAGSVIFHIISWAYVMVSGVIALQQLNMRVGDLNRDVEQG